ncbi:MAG TPA: hypothetical protein VGL86_09550 [Polyangia bacterium]|jgi:hypothetical protein
MLAGPLSLGGCAALTSAKGTADSAKGTADDAKSQKDSTTDAVKAEKDKGKGGAAGGGGGESAAGPTRLEATDGQINMPISDKIDIAKKKANDWRKFTLAGKPGQFATFIIHWDEEAANLDINVYDKFGVNVGKSPRRIEGQSSKQVLLRIDDPGLYYVRVSGATKTDNSIYTMEVKYNGPVVAPVTAAAAPAPAPAPAPGGQAAAPAPAPCPPGQNCPAPPDPNKVYGTIVSLVHDSGVYTLYLDKGSDAQLHSGMMGTILDGPEGDKPLDGGSFSITQVLGGSKSVAKSTTLQKPIGKNKRVVVNLK